MIKDSLDDLLFVEEGSSNCFCSEDCIEKFYGPIIAHYSNKINKLRKDLNLLEEDALKLLEDSSNIEKMLSKPDEIWRVENQLKEEIYTYIKKITKGDKTTYLAALCFVFNKSPSFILGLTATSNEFFLQQFQIGEQVESIDEYYGKQFADEYQIDPELLEQIEFKKSQYLANHLELRSEVDIPFENFELYVDYIGQTLDAPDESYSAQDEFSETFSTFIKAFARDGISFFYIVVCMQITSEEGAQVIVPVFSFPTIDGKLCDEYRRGEQLTGNLKN
ncbi:hypothetical protein [Bacteriovorax sp. Seq25_V]|uniref:hypothetical protein n=1 Tax=Bacteriovorax sp. Seq25_V TaxID=1201288 RepID=UPI00038A2B0A|nr:hypothetical protein [Bacteriovorax sp. Seq25_V]EQC46353.1 hypothetical protein M900_1068 [Bacteriovorax sp. Seq25_V]